MWTMVYSILSRDLLLLFFFFNSFLLHLGANVKTYRKIFFFKTFSKSCPNFGHTQLKNPSHLFNDIKLYYGVHSFTVQSDLTLKIDFIIS